MTELIHSGPTSRDCPSCQEYEFCTVCGKPTLLVQRFGEISTSLCERCASDPRIGEPELVEEAKRIRDKRVTYD